MPKKKKYYSSSNMMPSGMGQFANMYQGSFMKQFPKNSYMTTSGYPDKLVDIDRQINGAVSKAKKMQSKTKH
jgi:hypothetical protein